MPTNREADYAYSWPNNYLPSFLLPERKDGRPAYPPTYYGGPREVLPPLPRTLTELRLGQYQWRGSMAQRHTIWLTTGFLMGGLSRIYGGMRFFPFRRGIRPWGTFFGHALVAGFLDLWVLNLMETRSGRENMRLETLRRMRAKTLQEIRFEAQKSLEGLPQDYDGPMEFETM